MMKLPLKSNDFFNCENNFHKNWMNFYIKKFETMSNFLKWKKKKTFF
jgi:hypothetical protein